MEWLELSCRVDAEAVEAVSECFSRIAHGGVAVEPELIPGADDGFSLGSVATVRAYIPIDVESESKARVLDESLGHLHAIWPVGELVRTVVAEEDWANAWKAHFTTVRIGRRIVIRPTWIDHNPAPTDVVVSLDPGAAFGTGLHPTTNRCLQVLETIVQPGDRVFDVGTGSGILAIAAVALGAATVTGVDVDEIAVAVARANVQANGFSDKITIESGSVDGPDADCRYDIVVANIIARVIVEIAPRLVQRLKPSGTLITAGIITDRAEDVAIRLTSLGLHLERLIDGDWVTFVARLRLVD
jgi:ribosomal protein L11 methyltransferase